MQSWQDGMDREHGAKALCSDGEVEVEMRNLGTFIMRQVSS